MIILKLQPFGLDPGDVHISTIWQVCEDTDDFSNIIAETQEDTDNLLVKIFNVQTIPGKKYYARARIVSQNAGLSVWSNVDLEIASDVDNEITRNLEPNRIRPPRFNLDYELNEFPFAAFYIRLHKPEENTLEGHYATSWFIKNLNNEIIFASERDEKNLYEIFMDNVLKEGEVYIFEAQYHYKNNDNSMVSGITIITSKSGHTYFRKKEINNIGETVGTYNDGSIYLRAEIIVPSDAVDHIIEIYKDGILIDTTNELVYEKYYPEYGEDGFITARARSTLASGVLDNWVYYIFINTQENNGFVYDIPLRLG